MSIIRQIYNGDYRPADQEPEESPEHQAARERAYREYQALRDKLPMEQRPELDYQADLQRRLQASRSGTGRIPGASGSQGKSVQRISGVEG